MEIRTTIQIKRDERKKRIVKLFQKLSGEASKCRAAELIANEVGCSKGTVINTLNEAGQWR